MTTRLASLAAAGVLALALAGCGNGDQPATPGTAPEQTLPPVTQTTAPTEAAPAGTATTGAQTADVEEHNAAALRAIVTAEGAANGTAYEIDHDDNRWKVDVLVDARSIEVEVSTDGNTVASQDDDDDADDDDRARLDRAQITLTQAIEAALTEAPGRLDDADLDDENGQDVWEVSIDTADGDDIEVYVSTQDASIVKVDR